MATAIPAVRSYVGYAYESSYGSAGSPINKVFGHGQKLTADGRNNLERIWQLGTRDAVADPAKQFDGTWTQEFVLANPWFLRGVLGSPAATTGTGPYTHTYNENDSIPSETVEAGFDTDTQFARRLLGAAIQTCTLTAATGEVVRGRLEGPYQTESKIGSPIIAPAQRPTEAEAPYTFAYGTLQISGGIIADVQNFELTITNNIEPIFGLGSRFATQTPAKNREYNFRASVVLENSTDWMERMYGNAGSPVATTPNHLGNLMLKFDNGLSSTNQRVIQFNLGSAFIDSFTTTQDATDLVRQEIVGHCLYLGSATAINNTATAL